MPSTKIHCDFLEIYGPNWAEIKDKQAADIVAQIHEMEMLGNEPQQNGFVGTVKWKTIVGGFYAIQYEAELLHYDDQKRLDKRIDLPFERLFFILFAESGKLLLQTRKFADLNLTMPIATRTFKDALTLALQRSNNKYVLNMHHPLEETVPVEVFQEEFLESERVGRLRVSTPKPENIPEGFVYYNPEIERNNIIRESHQHDYEKFKVVDLEAQESTDLKDTHLANDLIEAGTPTQMKYRKNGEEQTLNRTIPRKVEMYVDVDVEILDQETLKEIVISLRSDYGLPIDVPVQYRSNQELPLFGQEESEESMNGDE